MEPGIYGTDGTDPEEDSGLLDAQVRMRQRLRIGPTLDKRAAVC